MKLDLFTIDPRFVSICIWLILGPRCQFLCVLIGLWMDHILSSKNLIKNIMNVLLKVGWLNKEDLSKKLLCFGIDGVNVFQG
jgi:hypothetical protein